VARTYPNLAAFLKDAHLTQEAFADEMGIAPSYVSMLLRGERTPSLPLALRIAERARIPLESLMGATAAVESGE
jgi:transcriptional regulator with XRE-family HTH domain